MHPTFQGGARILTGTQGAPLGHLAPPPMIQNWHAAESDAAGSDKDHTVGSPY